MGINNPSARNYGKVLKLVVHVPGGSSWIMETDEEWEQRVGWEKVRMYKLNQEICFAMGSKWG